MDGWYERLSKSIKESMEEFSIQDNTSFFDMLFHFMLSPEPRYSYPLLLSQWETYVKAGFRQFPVIKYDFRRLSLERLCDFVECAVSADKDLVSHFARSSRVAYAVNSFFGANAHRDIARELMMHGSRHGERLARALIAYCFEEQGVDMALACRYLPFFAAMSTKQLAKAFVRPCTVFLVREHEDAELLVSWITQFYMELEEILFERHVGRVVHYVRQTQPDQRLGPGEKLVLVRQWAPDASLFRLELDFRCVDLRRV